MTNRITFLKDNELEWINSQLLWFIKKEVVNSDKYHNDSKIIIEVKDEVNFDYNTWEYISSIHILNLTIVFDFKEKVKFNFFEYNKDSKKEIKSLQIRYSFFRKDCLIDGLFGSIVIFSSSFEWNVYIPENIGKILGIYLSNFHNDITLYQKSLENLTLEKNNFKNWLKIISWWKVTEVTNNFQISKLQLHNFIETKTFIFSNNAWKIESIDIHNMRITSGLRDDFLFEWFKVKNFYINKTINLSEDLIFSDIEINNLFSVNNSNLWTATFNNLETGKFFLKNTTISKTQLNATFLPNLERICTIRDLEVSNNELKDYSRQLKDLLDKNWNHTEANKFFAKEMEYYEKIIDSKKIFEKWWWRKLHNEGFSSLNAWLIWEKISLYFWSVISNHWNNLIKPIFLIFMLAFFATDIKFIYETYPNLFEKLPEFKIYTDVWVNELTNLLIKAIPIVIFYWLLFIFSKRFIYSTIVIFFIIIQFWMWYHIIDNFIWFLLPFTPFYWLDFSAFRELNSIEKAGLWLYKITYGIILWHLIIAAKRTTRR